jgi:hypothetical protein
MSLLLVLVLSRLCKIHQNHDSGKSLADGARAHDFLWGMNWRDWNYIPRRILRDCKSQNL